MRRIVSVAVVGVWCSMPHLTQAQSASEQQGSEVVAAIEFDPALLAGGGQSKLDISRFSLGNPLARGVYRVDVHVNNKWLTRRDVLVDGLPLDVCIDAPLLRLVGLAESSLTDRGRSVIAAARKDAAPSSDGDEAHGGSSPNCQHYRALASAGSVAIDLNDLRLDITVPQASLRRVPRGYVDPSSWEYGINAGMLGYNFNSFRVSSQGLTSSTLYLGLNGGFNVGRWRLRHNGSYASSSNSSAYKGLNTSVSTDLVSMQSSLELGEIYSNGQVFPSYSMKGISIGSDDRMLPNSQRGFAPVVRGVATTNSLLEVTQNGQLIHSATVPPGPFEINDLYPTGYGGDLVVTITDSAGSKRTWSVPYSTLPQLLREGVSRYALNAGLVRGYARERAVVQGTYQQGLSNTATLNLGSQVAKDYRSGLVGAAFNTPVGAAQTNLTLASFDRLGQRNNGYSLDLNWAKVIPETKTNFSLGAYRYSSARFYSLDDAMRASDADAGVNTGSGTLRIRTRAVLLMNQQLGSLSSMFLSANSQTYWDTDLRTTSYQVGVFHRIGTAQVSLNASRTLAVFGGASQSSFTLGVTIPLGAMNRTTASASMSRMSGGRSTEQAGVYGSLGDRSQAAYNVSSFRANGVSSGNASVSYRGAYANLGASVGSSPTSSQASVNASGGLVFADGALIPTPMIGETIGVVRAPGGQGLRVGDAMGTSINESGYAVVPYLSPYSANTVDLDLSSAPSGLQFESTSMTAAPHAGSVVLFKFEPAAGYSVQLVSRMDDGKPLPFAATVMDAAGAVVGSVGQASRIDVRLDKLETVLVVHWGAEPNANCSIKLSLKAPETQAQTIEAADVVCVRTQKEQSQQTISLAPSETEDSVKSLAHHRNRYVGIVYEKSGQPLPKGALILPNDGGASHAVVASGGRVAIRATADSITRLYATWISSAGVESRCKLWMKTHEENSRGADSECVADLSLLASSLGHTSTPMGVGVSNASNASGN